MFECTIHPFCLGTNISSSLLLDAAGTLCAMPLGWKGYIYFYNPDNEALYHVSYPLFSASITITAVRCQVKNTTWGGGKREEGRVKPIT